MLKDNIQNTTIGISKNIWYYATFILWFGSEIIFKSTLEYIGDIPISTYEQRVTLMVTIMLAVQIAFFQSYSKNNIIILATVSIVILIATYNSGYQYVASAWIFIMASKRCHLKQTTKVAFWVLTFGIIAVMVMYKMGIVTDSIYFRHGLVRHSYGFSHPNQLGLRIFQWILCFSYAYWDYFGMGHIILVSLVGYWMHTVTDSQTATICTFAYILMMITIKLMEKHQSKYITYVGIWLRIGSVIIGVASILLTSVDVRSIPVLRKLDRIISSRFYWTHKVYKHVGGSAFGKHFSTSAVMNGIIQIRRGMYFDNGYANLWLRFGFVVLVLFLLGYYLVMKKNAQNQLLTVILFIFSIYGIMEAGFIQLTHNIFLLSLAQIIYNDTEIENENASSWMKRIVFKF